MLGHQKYELDRLVTQAAAELPRERRCLADAFVNNDPFDMFHHLIAFPASRGPRNSGDLHTRSPAYYATQHFLYFLPLPHGHKSFLSTFARRVINRREVVGHMPNVIPAIAAPGAQQSDALWVLAGGILTQAQVEPLFGRGVRTAQRWATNVNDIPAAKNGCINRRDREDMRGHRHRHRGYSLAAQVMGDIRPHG
jgi:hypothetical protein